MKVSCLLGELAPGRPKEEVSGVWEAGPEFAPDYPINRGSLAGDGNCATSGGAGRAANHRSGRLHCYYNHHSHIIQSHRPQASHLLLSPLLLPLTQPNKWLIVYVRVFCRKNGVLQESSTSYLYRTQVRTLAHKFETTPTNGQNKSETCLNNSLVIRVSQFF